MLKLLAFVDGCVLLLRPSSLQAVETGFPAREATLLLYQLDGIQQLIMGASCKHREVTSGNSAGRREGNAKPRDNGNRLSGPSSIIVTEM
jgi:hypothetical protein